MDKSLHNFILFFTKYLMIFLMIANVAVMASLPFILETWMGWFYEPAIAQNFLTFYYALLYTCGILTLLILNNLHRLLDMTIRAQPFVRETEKRLYRMGIEGFLIGIFLTVKIFVQNSFMTMTSAVVFIIAGLFCFVLSDLFKRAVDYKEENDLTI